MRCNRLFAALVLALYLVTVFALPASAQDAAAAVSSEEVSVETAQASAQPQSEPLITPLMGGVGLVLLLALGAVTTRKRKAQDEMGYDSVWPDGERIEDPYSRLAGTGQKKKRRFF